MANIQNNPKFPHVDMTPMVDLGFLLIISFMLTTILSKPRTIDMHRHVYGDYGCMEKIPDIDCRTMLVLLLTDTDKAKFYSCPVENATKLDSVDFSKNGLRRLLFERKQDMTNLSYHRDTLFVFLKVTRQAKYKTVVDAIDELKISNTRFVLSTMEAIDSTVLGIR